MNDIRRTILWVIFGFAVVLLWDKWQVHNGNEAMFFPVPKPAASAAAPASAPAIPSSVPNAVPNAATNNAGAIPGALPAASGGQPPIGALGTLPSGAGTAPTPARESIVVSTDVLKLTFDSEGGGIIRSEFIKHTADNRTSTFVLLDKSAERVYLAESGLVSATPQGLPNHRSPMTFSGEKQLKDGAGELVVKFESQPIGGIKLVKTYTLRRGAYDIAVRHDAVNVSGEPVSAQLYVQLVRDGNKLPGESSFYSTFTGPAVYTETQKFQKIEFADIKKNKAEYEKEATTGYIAMVQHYFASAWILPEGMKRTLMLGGVNIGENLADCCYRVTALGPMEPVAPGATKTIEAKLFIGPQEEKLLEAIAPGLDLVKDYGWLTILAKPLYWLLEKLHSFLQNWGWSIVALVLLLKIAFYWLNAKAYSSMAKMKAINPRIMEMRDRLKDNPQQMQQEMMRIYREEKVNPMGGCFPIMIQIPVFIARYWVLLSSVEMRNAPWALWIKDLSAPDPYFILPIVMTLTTLLQTALNPAPPDPL
ncbi:MAG: membrane protein insertase YidC, partial [Burkholderiaceae bacterium]